MSQQADSTEGRFRNAQHDDCLDINGNAVTDGAHVVRWPCGDNPNQIFRVSAEALAR